MSFILVSMSGHEPTQITFFRAGSREDLGWPSNSVFCETWNVLKKITIINTKRNQTRKKQQQQQEKMVRFIENECRWWSLQTISVTTFSLILQQLGGADVNRRKINCQYFSKKACFLSLDQSWQSILFQILNQFVRYK